MDTDATSSVRASVRTRVKELDRAARLRLPPPLWRWAGTIARIPRLGNEEIRQTLREEAIIERAIASGSDDAEPIAPPGTSERVVEVPWVVRRAGRRGGRMLDVGTAFAPLVYLRALRTLDATELHSVDRVPVRLENVIAHTADVRALPLPSRHFDVVACISTLEHIGLDNAAYFEDTSESDEAGDVAALREIARVLSDDGVALVTVPAGRAATFPTQRQYSLERWRAVVALGGLETVEEDVFVHAEGVGWRRAGEGEPGERTYGEGAPYAAAVICAALQRRAGEPDGA